MNYFATTELRNAIREQGRTFRWVARQINVSESHFNRILNGERWVSRENADSISALLSVPFFCLWKVAEATYEVSSKPDRLAS